jgi:hypothetical protein
MQSRKKHQGPQDLNEIAFRVVSDATEETPAAPAPAGQERKREGGIKGGKARAASLTPEQRREIAQVAARARWKRV